MTIEQERDIAVRALERIARYPQRRDSELGYTGCRSVATHALGEIQRAQALQALVDQAQELDMGYGAAQASPVAQDELSDSELGEIIEKVNERQGTGSDCDWSIANAVRSAMQTISSRASVAVPAGMSLINNEELAAIYHKLSGKTHHESDCATSNAPAETPGPCDCAVPASPNPLTGPLIDLLSIEQATLNGMNNFQRQNEILLIFARARATLKAYPIHDPVPGAQPVGEAVAWLPTAESINALPKGIRKYIHDLSTLCDPQFIMQENAIRRDENEALQIMYRKSQDALAEVIGCFEAADIEGFSKILSDTSDENLKDIIERRLIYAFYAAKSAHNQEQS